MATIRQYFSRDVYEACRYGSAFSVEEGVQREIELSADYRLMWISMTDRQAGRFISEIFNSLKRDLPNRNIPKYGRNNA